uniref:Syndecan/Neurexin domain-containing protein n=1 Tax=Cyprinus carpio TaxID=7962 RepID=A0A8C1LT20_CYPCA
CTFQPEPVIAGGVIGFLFAIFLILLLVYRMRKKDEGKKRPVPFEHSFIRSRHGDSEASHG